MTNKRQDTLTKFKRLYDEEQYQSARNLLENDREDPFCRLNLAILHDRQKNPDDTLNLLHRLLNEDVQSGDYWYTVAALAHKLNHWEEAARAAKKATARLEQGSKKFLETKIREGFSLEGMREFSDAIEILEGMLDNWGRKTEQDGLHGEINHGLGHFYTELGLENGNYRDIRRGREYMRTAANEELVFTPCLGTIHSECQNYSEAVRIFEDGLMKEGIQNNDHIKNEIHFYKADAHFWLGESEKGQNHLERFKEYSLKYDNSDGLAHAVLYEAATYVRTTPLLEMTSEELNRHQTNLSDYRPSRYTAKSFRDYWKRLDNRLEFFITLVEFIDEGYPEEIIEELRSLALSSCKNEPTLYILSDDEVSGLPESWAQLSPRLKVISVPDGSDPGNNVSFYEYPPEIYLGVWQEEVPVNHALLINQDQDSICIISEQGAKVPEMLEPHVHRTGEPEIALKLTEILLCLDKIRWELRRPIFLFGMAPTQSAPSYSAQAGKIDFVLDLSEEGENQ